MAPKEPAEETSEVLPSIADLRKVEELAKADPSAPIGAAAWIADVIRGVERNIWIDTQFRAALREFEFFPSAGVTKELRRNLADRGVTLGRMNPAVLAVPPIPAAPPSEDRF